MTVFRTTSCLLLTLAMACCASHHPVEGDETAGDREVPGTEGVDPGWASLPTDQHTVPGPRSEVLLAEAEREFTQRNPATSGYSHTTQVDENTGMRKLDCSGFVDYAMRRVLPDAYALIPHEGHIRPKASDYEHLFASAPVPSTHPTGKLEWHQIRGISHMQAGDVIAWLHPADSRNRSTGHVMIARAGATHGRQGEWLVQIIDSTASPHAQDSRAPGQTGIGHGVIGLYTDPTGHPVSFAWRGGVSRRLHTTDIAIGRLE